MFLRRGLKNGSQFPDSGLFGYACAAKCAVGMKRHAHAREYTISYCFIKKKKGEKAGAGNKPGSVIDNHSSGTAVTSCL